MSLRRNFNAEKGDRTLSTNSLSSEDNASSDDSMEGSERDHQPLRKMRKKETGNPKKYCVDG